MMDMSCNRDNTWVKWSKHGFEKFQTHFLLKYSKEKYEQYIFPEAIILNFQLMTQQQPQYLP